jgi:hypothetical protein
LVAELRALYDDLKLDGVRVFRPSKFMFLCGGYISNDKEAKAKNLRDYLFRVRQIADKYNIVLAEKATQLFRDSEYDDLISFEEDIARIAAVVLVIAESPGSLAELGAFAGLDPAIHRNKAAGESPPFSWQSIVGLNTNRGSYLKRSASKARRQNVSFD